MPRFPVSPDHARRLREALGLSPAELARQLKVGSSSVHRYETRGAPAWWPLALGGLGLMRDGWGVAELSAHLGVDPDGGRRSPATPPADAPG